MFSRKINSLKKIISVLVINCFLASIFLPTLAQAQDLKLPQPTQFVPLSEAYSFPILKGMKFDPQNPFKMEFIIDTANQKKVSQDEASTLIKYFLAGLTIPEEELWVNLSPFEKDRMITETLSQTDIGKDLLSQDYLLKQITSSLTYPETEFGKDFWLKTYDAVQKVAQTINIPINTFNKIWIVPDKAVVHENGNFALVTQASLKTMLEEDYLALKNNITAIQEKKKDMKQELIEKVNAASSEVVRSLILPKINEEVNSGLNFAVLRQIYNALVLGVWFKKRFKESIYNNYINKGKVKGIDLQDKTVKDEIYNLYVEAFKKGVYNYIKTEENPNTKKRSKRQYFSGGFNLTGSVLAKSVEINSGPLSESDLSFAAKSPANRIEVELAELKPETLSLPSSAASPLTLKQAKRKLLEIARGLPGALWGLWDGNAQEKTGILTEMEESADLLTVSRWLDVLRSRINYKYGLNPEDNPEVKDGFGKVVSLKERVEASIKTEIDRVLTEIKKEFTKRTNHSLNEDGEPAIKYYVRDAIFLNSAIVILVSRQGGNINNNTAKAFLISAKASVKYGFSPGAIDAVISYVLSYASGNKDHQTAIKAITLSNPEITSTQAEEILQEVDNMITSSPLVKTVTLKTSKKDGNSNILVFEISCLNDAREPVGIPESLIELARQEFNKAKMSDNISGEIYTKEGVLFLEIQAKKLSIANKVGFDIFQNCRKSVEESYAVSSSPMIQEPTLGDVLNSFNGIIKAAGFTESQINMDGFHKEFSEDVRSVAYGPTIIRNKNYLNEKETNEDSYLKISFKIVPGYHTYTYRSFVEAKYEIKNQGYLLSSTEYIDVDSLSNFSPLAVQEAKDIFSGKLERENLKNGKKLTDLLKSKDNLFKYLENYLTYVVKKDSVGMKFYDKYSEKESGVPKDTKSTPLEFTFKQNGEIIEIRYDVFKFNDIIIYEPIKGLSGTIQIPMPTSASPMKTFSGPEGLKLEVSVLEGTKVKIPENKKIYSNFIDRIVRRVLGESGSYNITGWKEWPSKMMQELDVQGVFEKAIQLRDRIKKGAIKNLVIIGIGGSAAPLEAMLDFLYGSAWRKGPIEGARVFILDTTDKEEIKNTIIDNINFAETAAVVISKSGETLEPDVDFRVIKDRLIQAHKENYNDYIYAITDQKKGALHNEAVTEKYHNAGIVPDNIGGRFSIFTAVGMFLAAVLKGREGVENISKGAQNFENHEKDLENQTENNPALELAKAIAIVNKEFKGDSVYWAYGSENWNGEKTFLEQIQDESINDEIKMVGDEGKGPSAFVILCNGKERKAEKVFLQRKDMHIHIVVEELMNKNPLLKQEFEERVKRLSERGLPQAVIRLDKMDEFHLGLYMQLIHNVIGYAGEYLFDNPLLTYMQSGVGEMKNYVNVILGKVIGKDASDTIERLKKYLPEQRFAFGNIQGTNFEQIGKSVSVEFKVESVDQGKVYLDLTNLLLLGLDKQTILNKKNELRKLLDDPEIRKNIEGLKDADVEKVLLLAAANLLVEKKNNNYWIYSSSFNEQLVNNEFVDFTADNNFPSAVRITEAPAGQHSVQNGVLQGEKKWFNTIVMIDNHGSELIVPAVKEDGLKGKEFDFILNAEAVSMAAAMNQFQRPSVLVMVKSLENKDYLENFLKASVAIAGKAVTSSPTIEVSGIGASSPLVKLVEGAKITKITNKNIKPLVWGTAGARGRKDDPDDFSMDNTNRQTAGFAEEVLERINNVSEFEKLDLTEEQYLEQFGKQIYKPINGKTIRVAFAFDSRKESDEYAYEMAKVLAAYEGFEVEILDEALPTPIVARLTQQKRAQAFDFAFHVTPSHNQLQYGGIKLLHKGSVNEHMWTYFFEKRANNKMEYPVNPNAQIKKVRVVDELIKEYLSEVFPGLVNKFQVFKDLNPQAQFTVDLMDGSEASFAPLFERFGMNIVRNGQMKNIDYSGQTYVLADGKKVGFAPDPTQKTFYKNQTAYQNFLRDAPKGSIYFLIDGDGDRLVTIVKITGEVKEYEWTLPQSGVVDFGPDSTQKKFYKSETAYQDFLRGAIVGENYYLSDNNGDWLATVVEKKGLSVKISFKLLTSTLKPNQFGPLAFDYILTNSLIPEMKRLVRTYVTTAGVDAVARYHKLPDPVIEPVGSKYFNRHFHEAGGVEESGHFVVPGFFDDTIYQLGLILSMMSDANKDVFTLLDEMQERTGYKGMDKRDDFEDLTPEVKARFIEPLTGTSEEVRTKTQKAIDTIVRESGKELLEALVVVEGKYGVGKVVKLNDYVASLFTDKPTVIESNNKGIIVRFTDLSWGGERLAGTGNTGRLYTEGRESQEERQKIADAFANTLDLPNTSSPVIIDDEDYASPTETKEIISSPITINATVRQLRDKLGNVEIEVPGQKNVNLINDLITKRDVLWTKFKNFIMKLSANEKIDVGPDTEFIEENKGSSVRILFGVSKKAENPIIITYSANIDVEGRIHGMTSSIEVDNPSPVIEQFRKTIKQRAEYYNNEIFNAKKAVEEARKLSFSGAAQIEDRKRKFRDTLMSQAVSFVNTIDSNLELRPGDLLRDKMVEFYASLIQDKDVQYQVRLHIPKFAQETLKALLVEQRSRLRELLLDQTYADAVEYLGYIKDLGSKRFHNIKVERLLLLEYKYYGKSFSEYLSMEQINELLFKVVDYMVFQVEKEGQKNPSLTLKQLGASSPVTFEEIEKAVGERTMDEGRKDERTKEAVASPITLEEVREKYISIIEGLTEGLGYDAEAKKGMVEAVKASIDFTGILNLLRNLLSAIENDYYFTNKYNAATVKSAGEVLGRLSRLRDDIEDLLIEEQYENSSPVRHQEMEVRMLNKPGETPIKGVLNVPEEVLDSSRELQIVNEGVNSSTALGTILVDWKGEMFFYTLVGGKRQMIPDVPTHFETTTLTYDSIKKQLLIEESNEYWKGYEFSAFISSSPLAAEAVDDGRRDEGRGTKETSASPITLEGLSDDEAVGKIEGMIQKRISSDKLMDLINEVDKFIAAKENDSEREKFVTSLLRITFGHYSLPVFSLERREPDKSLEELEFILKFSGINKMEFWPLGSKEPNNIRVEYLDENGQSASGFIYGEESIINSMSLARSSIKESQKRWSDLNSSPISLAQKPADGAKTVRSSIALTGLTSDDAVEKIIRATESFKGEFLNDYSAGIQVIDRYTAEIKSVEEQEVFVGKLLTALFKTFLNFGGHFLFEKGRKIFKFIQKYNSNFLNVNWSKQYFRELIVTFTRSGWYDEKENGEFVRGTEAYDYLVKDTLEKSKKRWEKFKQDLNSSPISSAQEPDGAKTSSSPVVIENVSILYLRDSKDKKRAFKKSLKSGEYSLSAIGKKHDVTIKKLSMIEAGHDEAMDLVKEKKFDVVVIGSKTSYEVVKGVRNYQPDSFIYDGGVYASIPGVVMPIRFFSWSEEVAFISEQIIKQLKGREGEKAISSPLTVENDTTLSNPSVEFNPDNYGGINLEGIDVKTDPHPQSKPINMNFPSLDPAEFVGFSFKIVKMEEIKDLSGLVEIVQSPQPQIQNTGQNLVYKN